MKEVPKRIQTMRTIVAASSLGPAECGAIDRELQLIATAQSVKDQHRRSLLAVLHTTRALDTTARSLLLLHGIPLPSQPSLRTYLLRFENHSAVGVAHISYPQRKRFYRTIVKPRNRYMHTASAFPSVLQERTVLAEMQTCLTILVSL